MTDTSPALVPRPLWRRLLKPVLVVAVLAVVFGWILPQFIDYQEVWEAITELDGWEVLVLLALGLARIPTEALMYRASCRAWVSGAEARPTSPRISRASCSRPRAQASSSTARAITLSRFRKTNPDVLPSGTAGGM